MKVNIEKLDKRSKTPVLTYCRKLIKKGIDPSETLEIYRKDLKTGQNHQDWDIRVRTIEEGAKLGVSEGTRHGPEFVKFKDWYPSSLKHKKRKLEGDV